MTKTAKTGPGGDEEFLQNLNDSGLFTNFEISSSLTNIEGQSSNTRSDGMAQQLLDAGKLTAYQAAAVSERNFTELVVGNYEILDRLGAGGMGTVYKARHRRMKRIVALKVLSRAACESPMFLQRFQREVEVISRLSHPNIVMAFDADEAEMGHFLVMEFVDGRDLASEVANRGPLPVAEAVAALLQSARALEYAHAQGIIHRDIKPANLLRDQAGVVKVADLGLARASEVLNASARTALTQAGGIVGTVDYMPPEQAVDSTAIDFRADVYSLGCTFHYLLTGRPPYQGESLVAILLKHRDGPIPSLPAARADIPPSVDAIFRKAVAKKPEDRFASMTELVQALEALSAGAPAQVAAPAPVLLVEPSRTQANIIRKFLSEMGTTEIVVALSGQKALEAMHAARPRAIVSAMHLDDMTGAQLLRKIRGEASFADVGFVLITSDQSEASDVRGLAHTVLLPKPFDGARLSQALASAESAS